MLVPVKIRKLLIPAHQAKLFGVLRPQPPMICFAFKVKAVVAAIWALNFHTPIRSFRSRLRAFAPAV